MDCRLTCPDELVNNSVELLHEMAEIVHHDYYLSHGRQTI